MLQSSQLFQLTSSRRGWPLPDLSLWLYSISTHILTKRMTKIRLGSVICGRHFNSHPHEEDDKSYLLAYLQISYFNSHPHEEDDYSYLRNWMAWRYFNSHPHEEDDQDRRWNTTLRTHFNSHPHEEDDNICNQSLFQWPIFQLTSSRRGWRFLRSS